MKTRSISRTTSLIVALALLLSALPASGFTWREADDALDLPATAQVTDGHGCLTVITGGLAAAQDVDMYKLEVVTPSVASIVLQCTATSGPDIWVFDVNGNGVAATSTCAAGGKQITSAFILTPGTYFVAVASSGMRPYADTNPIWAPGGAGERAPNGTGAAEAVTGWVDTGAVLTDTTYRIELARTVDGITANFWYQRAAPVPDYNGDGRYDACDEVALSVFVGRRLAREPGRRLRSGSIGRSGPGLVALHWPTT